MPEFKVGDSVNIVWREGLSTGSIPVEYIEHAMKSNPHTIRSKDGWWRLKELDFWWSPDILEHALDLKNPDWRL